jgi:hypothetical protein
MTQDGSNVRGSLDLQTVPGPSSPNVSPQHYRGDLTGTFDADGVLSLQGPTRIVLSVAVGELDSGVIQDWRTHVTSGVQEGTFSHVFPPTESFVTTTGTVKWTSMTLKK